MLLALLLCACGGRTPPNDITAPVLADGGSQLERCNGLDDDEDGNVDEGFRDLEGRYVSDEHCGACGRGCDIPIDNATATACTVIGDTAMCAAASCDDGFELTSGGRCAASDDFVCLPCLRDQDCGPTRSARCMSISGESRCTRDCSDGCPEGYLCEDGDHCAPEAGSCRCPLDDSTPFEFACEVRPGCIGRAECRDGVTTSCEPEAERCGGEDEDCDGALDEGFIDERGAYSLDPKHCGACGRDCTLDEGTALPLMCGGDPFAPSCVIACPDAADGIQVGDMLDADRDIDNGCECRVRSLTDAIGSSAGDGVLDENCDGADGNVLSSFYVATTGDDANPGSPTRPLATIDEAVRRAAATASIGEQRLDVFVAGGVYTETVHLLDGVRVHGGYRTDYLERDPSGYEVIVVAPAMSAVDDPPGGAALVVRDAGSLPTLIEGIELRGRDAVVSAEAALGAIVLAPGPLLTLRDLRIRAGRPARGESGHDGDAGTGPSRPAQDGRRPRAAIEDSDHRCFSSDSNTTRGGGGGVNVCNDTNTSGGNGGSAICPLYESIAEPGRAGLGFGATPGGDGGLGGVDLEGPIVDSTSCPGSVCCGLADFSVPGDTFLALPGEPGADGQGGAAGEGCIDATGRFDADANWSTPFGGVFGTSGRPGAGGGGGGAGGGAQINWHDLVCEFADGIGGSGGGGGAGGCGGNGGGSGQSGAPSIAVLVLVGFNNELPVIEDSVLHTQDGGDGGDGGNGGDGGPGGGGGFGGRVPDDERLTPSLAGPSGGERGGKGGDGGPGGGAGGGCGGNSVGVWIAGVDGVLDPSPFSTGNTFELGNPGTAGLGGGGPIPGAPGNAGQRLAVLIQ